MDLGGPRGGVFSAFFACGSRNKFFKGSKTRNFFSNNVSASQVFG